MDIADYCERAKHYDFTWFEMQHSTLRQYETREWDYDRGRRNSPVSGCEPSRIASNCSWLTLPCNPQELRTTTPPHALHPAVFIVVVAVFQVALGVASAARHGPNGQHNSTLTLFEIGAQLGEPSTSF